MRAQLAFAAPAHAGSIARFASPGRCATCSIWSIRWRPMPQLASAPWASTAGTARIVSSRPCARHCGGNRDPAQAIIRNVPSLDETDWPVANSSKVTMPRACIHHRIVYAGGRFTLMNEGRSLRWLRPRLHRLTVWLPCRCACNSPMLRVLTRNAV